MPSKGTREYRCSEAAVMVPGSEKEAVTKMTMPAAIAGCERMRWMAGSRGLGM